MIKGRRFLSLRLQFIAVLAVSLLLALLMGVLVSVVGTGYIQWTYMSEEQTQARLRRTLADFQQFVEEKSLDVHNAVEIIRWAKSQNRIYLLVSNGERIIVDSGWWDEQEYYTDYADAENGDGVATAAARTGDGAADTSEDGISFGYGVASTTVQFIDGAYSVTVYDFSEEPLYEGVQVASYAVAILLFILMLMLYHSRIIRRIIDLSQEVEMIAGGELEKPIVRQRADELGALAQHVDTMRFSIINEMRAEQEAWNANSDLITRMSHDIRTPLTVLLGFLELLEEGEYSADETYGHYLAICKKNAYQLKSLAERLFQYFLVFGHREQGMDLEIADARVLLGQLIGEHTVWLTEQGWQVESTPLEGTVFIEVDTVYTKRLCDNIFSNIEKYADPAQVVEIRQWTSGNELHVTVRNRVRSDASQVESTNIGLKTCERIMELMGGQFLIQKTEEEFCVELRLPVYQEPEEETPPVP